MYGVVTIEFRLLTQPFKQHSSQRVLEERFPAILVYSEEIGCNNESFMQMLNTLFVKIDEC